ncbi:unnamed protein product [Mytilus coruscus]|uniref:Uncharacterized protein n=1 Tax=Mytilus coruscus TaxID=42192 RepID=A0A6J8A7X3_MYTCO|nr:unnamed protein product [Mytilus coruscus]
MSFYVTISNDKGKEYYPNNKAYKFTSHLNAPLILNGVWRVALVEADITSTNSKVDPIYLYSNICGESIIYGEQKPLLRRITAADLGNWSSILDSPHYIPVRVNEIYDIDIYKTDSQNLYIYIRSRNHQLYVDTVVKKGLFSFDDKRYWRDSIESYAFGHYKIK